MMSGLQTRIPWDLYRYVFNGREKLSYTVDYRIVFYDNQLSTLFKTDLALKMSSIILGCF